jgi:hypothetical protein
METLTSYRGRIRNGQLVTDPPIPLTVDGDVVVTFLSAVAESGDQMPPDQIQKALQAINQLYEDTRHLSGSLSDLILSDRQAER